MAWSAGDYHSWFTAYHATVEARQRSAAAASRRGLASMSDDLHQAWYLSVRTTVDRLGPDGDMPDWLASDEDAIRYALRVLHNDATDFQRVQYRLPTPVDLATTAEPVDLRTAPDGAAELRFALAAMRRELQVRYRAGLLGSPQCRAERVLALALGVVERLVGAGGEVHEVVADSAAPTDWDRVIYDVLHELDAERFTMVDGRMSAAARQMKARCGTCVRDLLRDLAQRHLGGFDDPGHRADLSEVS